MSFIRDQRSIVTVRTQINAIDAVTKNSTFGQYFNAQIGTYIQHADDDDETNRPINHQCFQFWTREFPLATEYPDETAPIGSVIHHFEDLDGATTGYRCYCKMYSNSWVAKSNHTRTIEEIGGTVTVAVAAYEGECAVSITGITGAGIIPEGLTLDLDGTPYVTARRSKVDAGSATIYIKGELSADLAAAAVVDNFVYGTTSVDSVVITTLETATTLFLPLVANSKGARITIQDDRAAGTANITIDAQAGDTLSEAVVLNAAGEAAEFYCDGTEWKVLNTFNVA